MAEKRMVHRNLTKSDKLLHIAKTRGWRACFFYTAHIPFLDKAGRMKANPLGLKGTIWEVHPVTVEELAGDLDALADVGLIRLYRTPKGEVVMQYAKFDEEHGGFNKPHPNEPESEYPDPDADGCREEHVATVAENGPDNVVHNNPPQRSDKDASEYEIEKEKEIEKEVSQDLSSASPTRAENHERLAEIWNYHCGVLPQCEVIGEKRATGFDRTLREFGDEAFARFEAATRYVASETYWQQQGYNIDNLLVRGRVLEKSEKFNANRGMSAGDRKLASTAMEIQRAIGGLDA